VTQKRKRRGKLTPEARAKQLCRQKSTDLWRSGQLKRLPCEQCGNPKSQKHYPDYSDPHRVMWLCEECHWRVHFEISRGVFLRLLAASGRCST